MPVWLTLQSVPDQTALALGQHYLGGNLVRHNPDEEATFNYHFEEFEPITSLIQLEERLLEVQEAEGNSDCGSPPPVPSTQADFDKLDSLLFQVNSAAPDTHHETSVSVIQSEAPLSSNRTGRFVA